MGMLGQNKEETNDGDRQADPQTNGDTAQGASDGAGADSSTPSGEGAGEGAGTGGVVVPIQALMPGTAVTLTSSVYYFHPGIVLVNPGTGYVPEPKLETLPPEVGEIVAWRAWRVFGPRDKLRLKSVAHWHIWEPDKPMEGDPSRNIIEGVYASKTREAIEGSSYAAYNVVGRVALWGDVIEHDNGYRAQFARVMSIELPDHLVVRDDVDSYPEGAALLRVINDLRRTYGLPYQEMPPEPIETVRNTFRFVRKLVGTVAGFAALMVATRFVAWLIQTLAQ